MIESVESASDVEQPFPDLIGQRLLADGLITAQDLEKFHPPGFGNGFEYSGSFHVFVPQAYTCIMKFNILYTSICLWRNLK